MQQYWWIVERSYFENVHIINKCTLDSIHTWRSLYRIMELELMWSWWFYGTQFMNTASSQPQEYNATKIAWNSCTCVKAACYNTFTWPTSQLESERKKRQCKYSWAIKSSILYTQVSYVSWVPLRIKVLWNINWNYFFYIFFLVFRSILNDNWKIIWWNN